MQQGSTKHFVHTSWPDGTWQIESKKAPNTSAIASLTPLESKKAPTTSAIVSLTPLEMCRRVSILVLKFDSSNGKD